LLRVGADVTVLDLPTADWTRFPAGVQAVKADILEEQSLRGVFDTIDIVYHLAARTDLDGKSVNDYKVNSEGTKNVLEESVRTRIPERFVFYSTHLVVGVFNETRFIEENEPYKTKTPYGESKIAGEEAVRDLCHQAGLAYTIIRPTSVYGPWGGTPYREFFRAIKSRRYFHVGKAANLVSWVYVKNLVDLTVLASLSDQAVDQVFFGNDFNPYTMRQIVDTVGRYYGISVPTVPSSLITGIAYTLGLAKALGADVPIYPFRLRNIKANYCYDIQKSLRIGYDPGYGLSQGIQETLDWYEANKLI
jgi:nucleoside-diphosphate-sugar epimerase